MRTINDLEPGRQACPLMPASLTADSLLARGEGASVGVALSSVVFILRQCYRTWFLGGAGWEVPTQFKQLSLALQTPFSLNASLLLLPTQHPFPAVSEIEPHFVSHSV